jgi:hypothetical protein
MPHVEGHDPFNGLPVGLCIIELASRINNRSLRLSLKHPLICEDESDRGYVSVNRADQFWQSIRPHAERFGTINATPSKFLLDILSNGLKCLEKLILRGGGLTTSLEKPWPNLRYLQLYGISLPWSLPLVFNLSHLALERVSDLPFGVLVEILRSSPQLEELKLNSIAPIMDRIVSPVNSSALLLLPSLRILRMMDLSGDLLHRILNLIEPHHLEALSLSQQTI